MLGIVLDFSKNLINKTLTPCIKHNIYPHARIKSYNFVRNNKKRAWKLFIIWGRSIKSYSISRVLFRELLSVWYYLLEALTLSMYLPTK